MGTGPTDPLIASFDYDYDEADNITRKTVSVTGYPSSENGAWDYHYDMAGRMDWAEDPEPANVRTTYEYDGAGNRTRVQVGTQTAVVMTYDGAGFPDSASDGTDYVTDDMGSLKTITKAGQTSTYDYDAWGRLATATTTSPAATVNYVLDALDRTTSRTEGGTTTTFDYVGTSEDPAKVTEGSTETVYGWSPSGPVAQMTGSTKRFLIRDLHQDVVALIDPAGANTGRAAYSPWGEVRSGSGDSSRLGYQGDLTDSRTGLVDMLTRLYAPGLGRFTTQDVLFGDIPEPLSLNQYAYTHGSPVTFIDPDGMRQEAGGGDAESTRAKQNEHRRGRGQTSGAGLPAVVDLAPEPPPPIEVHAFPVLAMIQVPRILAVPRDNGGGGGVPYLPRPPAPYQRPTGATTPQQRASVQGRPCVICRAEGKQFADHKYPLVREWYEQGRIDLVRARSASAVQPNCPSCSAAQGGRLSWYSRQMRDRFFPPG